MPTQGLTRRETIVAALIAVVLVAFVFAARPALAHEGHDHSADTSSVSTGNMGGTGAAGRDYQSGGFSRLGGSSMLVIGGAVVLVAGVTVALLRVIAWAGRG